MLARNFKGRKVAFNIKFLKGYSNLLNASFRALLLVISFKKEG